VIYTANSGRKRGEKNGGETVEKTYGKFPPIEKETSKKNVVDRW